MEPVVQNPPNTKLKQLYEYLKSKNVKVHNSYEKFETSMQDDTNLKKAYDFVTQQPDARVARDYDQFKLNLGVKKKDETISPTYGPLLSAGTYPTQTVSPQQELQEALKDPLKTLSDVSENILNPQAPEPVIDPNDPTGSKALQQYLMQSISDSELGQKIKADNTPATPEEEAAAEYYVKKPRSLMGALNNYGGAFNKPVLEAPGNLLKSIGVGGSAIDRAVGISDKTAQETPTYQLGQKWNNLVKPFIGEIEPQYQEDFLTQLFSGLGSIASLIVARGNAGTSSTGMLTQAAAQSLPKMALNTIASRPGVVAGTFAIDEYENAKKAGVPEDEAFKVFLKNYFVNQTDAIPLEVAFSKLNTLFKGSISQGVSAIGQGGLIEGTQEGLQQYLTNQIAKGSYDPSRDELFQVLDNIKVGGVLGMLLPAIGSVAQNAPANIKAKLLEKAKVLEDKAVSFEEEQIKSVENVPHETSQPIESVSGDIKDTPVQDAGLQEASVQPPEPTQSLEGTAEAQPKAKSDEKRRKKGRQEKLLTPETSVEPVPTDVSSSQEAPKEDVPAQIEPEAVQEVAEEKSGLEPDQDSEPASVETSTSESDTPEIDDKQVEFEWLTGETKKGVVIGKAEGGKVRVQDAKGKIYRVDRDKLTVSQEPEKIEPSKKKKTISDPSGVREEVDEKRREINTSPKDVEKQGKKATVKTVEGEKMVNDLAADMHNKSAPLPRGVDTNEKNIRRNDRRKKPLGLVGDNHFLKEMDLDKITDKAGKFYRKYFKTGRGMPNSVLDLDQKRMAYIAENEYAMKNAITDLKNAIPKAFKKGKVSDANIISMNNYLQGKPAQKLPKVVTDVLDRMRPHVDGLSRVMMDEGIVSDEMKPTFMKNLGVYLNTSYRKFDDPYWAEYVPDNVKNQAVSVIRGNSKYKAQEYFARATRLRNRENNKQDLIDRLDKRTYDQQQVIQRANANLSPAGARKRIAEAQEKIKQYQEISAKIQSRDFAAEAAEQEAKGKELFNIPDEDINGLINYLLYNPEAPAAVLKGGKLGSKDLTVLKRRKEIDPIIKALMGEYTDPVLNFARTITKQANLIANHRFLNNMKQAGLQEGWLSEKPTETLYAPVAAEGSKTMSPMNGIYTSPEIAEALNEYNKKHVFEGISKYYMALNSYVKVAKTIYSPVTHMRNFWGNMFFAIANNHWRFDKFGDSYNALKDQFTNNQKTRDKITEYIKLGLVKNGAVAGELRQYVKDIQNGTDFFEKLNDSKVKKWKRAIVDTAQDMYQTEDDLFKIYAFENEYARYKAAFPKTPDQEIKERVSKIVLDTYPTFSKVPEVVKEMRKIPVVGTFVSFPAEVIRTTKNTIKLAFEEMSDPATRLIGAQRLAGLIAAIGLPYLASVISRQILGVSDGEDDDIRWILPPWEQNSYLWYHSKDGDTYEVTDLSSVHPHAFLTDPAMQMIGDYNKGKSPARAIGNGFNMFLEPFASEELLFQKIIDIERNIDPEGKQIYNPDADADVAIKQISDHLRQALEPGAVKLAGDFQKTLQGYQGIHGDEYTKKALAYQLIFGLRSKKRDASTAMNFRVQDLKARVEVTNRFYNQIKYKKNVPPEELAKAEAIKESALKRISDEANALYGAMIRLGVSPKEAKTAFFRTRTPEIIMKLPKE